MRSEHMRNGFCHPKEMESVLRTRSTPLAAHQVRPGFSARMTVDRELQVRNLNEMLHVKSRHTHPQLFLASSTIKTSTALL